MAKAKKSVAKGTSGSKRAPASGNPQGNGDGEKSLAALLANDVETQLVRWQSDPGRDGMRKLILDLCSLDGNREQLLSWAVARTKGYQSRIQAAQDNGKLYPWIVPYSAAVLFEAMFQACAGAWLLAGEPESPDRLLPSVKSYIDVQARTFALLVGP